MGKHGHGDLTVEMHRRHKFQLFALKELIKKFPVQSSLTKNCGNASFRKHGLIFIATYFGASATLGFHN